MALFCITIYIMVELYECSSSLYGLNGSNLPKFQRRLYVFSTICSYGLNMLIGGGGIYFILPYYKQVFIVVISLALLFWIRDIISGTLTKLIMIHFYNRRADFLKKESRKEQF